MDEPSFGNTSFHRFPSQHDGYSGVPSGAPLPCQQVAGTRALDASPVGGARARRRKFKVRLLWRAACAGALGCVLFAGLSGFGRDVGDLGMGPRGIDGLGRSLGLGIDQVSLRGHEFTSDSDVFDALQLDKSKTFLSFDAQRSLARIGRLPWVKTASIERVLPGRLAVRIEERTPFALWRMGDEHFLIDETGHVLGRTDGRANLALPLVAGGGAPRETAGLLRLVGGTPLVARSFALARRVSGRRWTIELTTGATLLLPAQGEASALALVSKAPELKAALRERGAVVDMRAENRIAVSRPLGAGVRGLRQANGGRAARQVALGGRAISAQGERR